MWKFALSVLLVFGICQPAFAIPPASWPSDSWPRYYKDYKYIKAAHCSAVAMEPYSGKTLYECPDGESFWSPILVPSADSPLFMYFKNRKEADDTDAIVAGAAASSAAVSTR